MPLYEAAVHIAIHQDTKLPAVYALLPLHCLHFVLSLCTLTYLNLTKYNGPVTSVKEYHENNTIKMPSLWVLYDDHLFLSILCKYQSHIHLRIY